MLQKDCMPTHLKRMFFHSMPIPWQSSPAWFLERNAVCWPKKCLKIISLAPASIYFKYYLHLALVKAGLGNDYLTWLDKWYENIAMGMTTWAEDSNVNGARSDCHAWGASPNIEFYRIVLGIDTDAPGFKRVKIEPHLGDLKTAGGEIPHPMGKISVSYKLEKGKWNVMVNLPGNLTGTFVWEGKVYALKSGDNNIDTVNEFSTQIE